ncbi:hypothetical protein HC766_04755 [Candidatus Gracilibacteria bacterium]|nr:hypothetical protein [Candidatus Gracilibacteria bacterium]
MSSILITRSNYLNYFGINPISMANQLDLYKKYFVDNNRESIAMFEILADLFKIQSVLYMGSFVHISPALVISNCVFVDNDRRVAKFFEDEEVAEFVNKNKKYKEDASFQAFQQNYEKPLPLKNNSFDLLISQYAGIISETGKKYLKKDGILLVNSSHGDAAVAHLDEDLNGLEGGMVLVSLGDLVTLILNTISYPSPKNHTLPKKKSKNRDEG